MDTPVTGSPRLILRLEGLAVLLAAVFAYQAVGAPWLLFAALLLVPDVSFVGYVISPRVGAAAYNAVHTYLSPAGLAALGVMNVMPDVWSICLVWVAHIGMDRALGLGLKFPDAFHKTHLGAVGRVAPTT